MSDQNTKNETDNKVNNSGATSADDPDFYFKLGNDHYSQGQYHLAIDAYIKAIEQNPSNYEIYHNAGIISVELEKYDLAVDFLEKAVSINPQNDESYYFLGFSYEIQGHFTEALENYQKAITLNQDHAGAGLALAGLTKVIEQGKEDSVTYFDLAINAIKKNEYDIAIENFYLATKANPDHAEAYFELGKLYYDNADYYTALNNFNRAISIKPELAEDAIFKTLKAKLSDEKIAVKLLSGLKDKLNNLNPRNRSLRLLRTSKDWNFDLHDLERIEPGASYRILNCLIKDITPIPLMDLKVDSSVFYDQLEDDYVIKLQKNIFNSLNSLHRKINSIESETGIYDLFVGYPFVECNTVDGSYLRAPLLLNPCHIEKVKDPCYGWILKTDNEFRPIFNDTLFMALKKFNNTVIPDEFCIMESDVEEKDLLEWSINYFRDNGIPIVLNQDLDNTVEKLPQLKIADIPELDTGKIFIRPFAVLGIFPQSTSNLRPDYEHMIENPDTLDSVLELLGKKDLSKKDFSIISYNEIDKISEQEKFPITNTDESQERVLVSCNKNQDFVLYGPPGTGKSHIILNIIADAMARDKKVLVVCQKRAALDVIYNRMSAEGLSDYIALVHDHERDKKTIFKKLSTLIAHTRTLASIPADNNDSNKIETTSNKIETTSNKIDSLINNLNNLAAIQQTRSQIGLTPHEIYCKLSGINNEHIIEANKDFLNYIYDDFKELIDPIIQLGSYFTKFETTSFALKHRRNWSGKTDTFKDKLLSTLQEITKINTTILELNNYFKSQDIILHLDKNNPESLFIRRNKLINFFSARNIKINEYQETINAFKATLESVKVDYFKIKDLLVTELPCRLQLLDLIKKVILIKEDKVLSISGYENSCDYSNLDIFINDICKLSEYYQNYEQENRILIRNNRNDFTQFKADLKLSSQQAISETLKLIVTLKELTEKVSHYKIELKDLWDLANLSENSIDLLKAIRVNNNILQTLNNWKKSDYPEFNFSTSLNEAKDYLNQLNSARWEIYKNLDLNASGNLKDNISIYSSYKGFIKYLIPAWWKAKKHINTILSSENIEISATNANNISSKVDLTHSFNKLQQIISVELYFISNHEKLKEAEIISILEDTCPYFATFKALNESVLFNIIKNSENLNNTEDIDKLLEDFNLIYNYIFTFNSVLKGIYSLEDILKKDFINNTIDTFKNNSDITEILTGIYNELENFEDIRIADNLHNNLSEAQLFILNSLVSYYGTESENLSDLWKEVISNSFLQSWYKLEKSKHSELTQYSCQELQELGTDYTQNSFEETISNMSGILESYDKLYSAINSISYAFKENFIEDYKNLINNYEKLNNLTENLINCFNDFDEIIKMDNIKDSLNETQQDLFDKVSNKWNSTDDNLSFIWQQAITSSYLDFWINIIEKENPVLLSVSDNTIDKTVKDLKNNYLEKLKLNKEFICKKYEESIKPLPTTDKVRGGIKLKDLEYQVNKKRRLWSLRKLMQQFGETHILKYLPCWLMSPESVSSVMPYQKDLFDIVIFDEASQCAQEYALPSIVRAKQVIIAGDEKQLPPLDIFHTTLDEEFDDEIATEAQSLLSLAKAIYPTYLLSWHYRSKFEELINFSNHAFYDGRIQIAPNVQTVIKPPAIEWIDVKDGLWIKNCNKKEALEIVEYIKNLVTDVDKPPTIGVITFNTTQQNLILDLLDKKEAEDPDFSKALSKIKQLELDDRLFVKNIENVQGDERDLIIFSIGYARNYQGKVSTNFGLLNRVGGENRLNVAITRAREKIVVFSSVQPDDFNVANSKHAGPKLFRKYLEYAKNISSHDSFKTKYRLQELNPDSQATKINSEVVFNSTFEEDVYKKLTAKGYEVKTQIGCSGYKIDLAIIDPENPSRFILGIECDGKNYYDSDSARSRDITRKEFLEAKGWVIKGIWSRNWLKNSDKEIKQITKHIKGLKH